MSALTIRNARKAAESHAKANAEKIAQRLPETAALVMNARIADARRYYGEAEFAAYRATLAEFGIEVAP